MKVIPTSYPDYAHRWIILYGRYVCKAVSPLCDESACCEIYAQTMISQVKIAKIMNYRFVLHTYSLEYAQGYVSYRSVLQYRVRV
ncbi:MAG: hypothetical protein OXC30_00960 [Alphaproteobacteria bacterium]|nr:hypothetical protein [Alphaproteobacteria bacterium]